MAAIPSAWLRRNVRQPADHCPAADRPRLFNGFDRLVFVGLYRLFPDLRDALAVVRPETVIRWHRAGSEPIGVGGQGRDGEDRRCRLRSANCDPRDEPCQSAVGSSTDPWRTAQTRPPPEGVAPRCRAQARVRRCREGRACSGASRRRRFRHEHERRSGGGQWGRPGRPPLPTAATKATPPVRMNI